MNLRWRILGSIAMLGCVVMATDAIAQSRIDYGRITAVRQVNVQNQGAQTAGTLVGGLIGYGIDWLFGTLPFGLIFFLLLGFGAGFLNLVRAAKRMPPAQERLNTNPPPKAAFDDEEED